MIFGAFLPQGWKMELSSIDGAEAKWAKAVEIAVLAEQLGYDSIWVYDHFHNVPRPAHEAVFECWTTMAAISQRTSRIRLGQMVGCNSYRQPSVLAKITSTIDVISGGRLDWGIGAGWYENEYRGYGFEFPAPKVRIGMLRECVEIVHSMWTDKETTYEGRYYSLSRAHCDPKPLQDPHPPIWIGGGGAEADACASSPAMPTAPTSAGSPTSTPRSASCSRATAKTSVVTTTRSARPGHPRCSSARPKPSSRKRGRDRSGASPSSRGRRATWWAHPSRWPRRIQQYRDLGCTGIVPWCADYPDTETLTLFAEKVIPQFR